MGGGLSPDRLPWYSPPYGVTRANPRRCDRLAAVCPLQHSHVVVGIATTGGVRPSSDGGKRSGSRYVLGDLLGRGGMAEVFAGHAVGDHGFQKPVAIKRLLPEPASDTAFVGRP